ncbi:hypothetical protein Ms3S1_36900 [Methylosinus sp. 3S-1]
MDDAATALGAALSIPGRASAVARDIVAAGSEGRASEIVEGAALWRGVDANTVEPV